MQREIEALLKAYLQETNREQQLIQDVLTALAVGASARQQMIATIQATFATSTVEPEAITKASAPSSADEVANAINQLRAARGLHATH